jgi:tetratricopeptide (TPR) repeat protein
MRNAIFVTGLGFAGLLLPACAPDPGPAKAELNAGYGAFFQSQDYDGALADAERFLQHTPNGPGSAEAHYLQGRVYEQRAQDGGSNSDAAKANLDAARTAYTRALTVASAPKVQALIHAELANIAYHVDDYGTAVREWQVSYAAVEPLEAKAWVLYRIGVCQQRLGWFPQADRSFGLVRANFPGTEPAQRASQHEGATGFYVQVGAYKDFANANRSVSSLKTQGLNAEVVAQPSEEIVRVGPVPNFAAARSLQIRLIHNYPDAVVVP